MEIVSQKQINKKNSVYKFSIFVGSDMPKDSYWTLTIPSEVGLPSQGTTDLSVSCQTQCEDSGLTLDWNQITRTLTFFNGIPNKSNAFSEPGPLIFELTGLTNPSTADPVEFVYKSFAVINGQAYLMDVISGLKIQAETGACSVLNMYPTDGNYMIYGVAESWFFEIKCENEILTDYGIQVAFPEDWYVIQTQNCSISSNKTNFVKQYWTVSGYLYNTPVKCYGDRAANTIEAYNFLREPIDAYEYFEFAINYVRSPTRIKQQYEIKVSTVTQDGGLIDSGTWLFKYNLMKIGEIWQFKVTPRDLGVGQFPVFYDVEF